MLETPQEVPHAGALSLVCAAGGGERGHEHRRDPLGLGRSPRSRVTLRRQTKGSKIRGKMGIEVDSIEDQGEQEPPPVKCEICL